MRTFGLRARMHQRESIPVTAERVLLIEWRYQMEVFYGLLLCLWALVCTIHTGNGELPLLPY